ncbi:dihydrodipicolinate synthase family protein [Pseudomonas laurentiana]|nr:dihydrodipicolinate synthase family protein [Pseudomonas laurentiana]GGU53259.1 dihydrodipicolinate synthase family protein [Pseudomonas laurentiana]
MLTGLSAFPLTPVTEYGIEARAYIELIKRLVDAGVDSIGALGSTGSYMYLNRLERAQAARLAVEHASGIPVMVGISALSTRDVLLHAEDAQEAGVDAVLLSPVSYQKLSDKEVYGLYNAVARNLSVPLVVYDNPGTTNFVFSDELHSRIAELPNVASIKIPGVPEDPVRARDRVDRLRNLIPEHVTIGVSGDSLAATGLNAGCDIWYSVIGGLFPEIAVAITRAAQKGNANEANQLSSKLQPLWSLFSKHGGSLRVIATAATLLGRAPDRNLPSPLLLLEGEDRSALLTTLNQLDLV